MPTTRSRTLKSRTELERDRELEALGLGIAPAADPPALPGELIDDALGRASDRRRVHAALGMPAGRRISNEMIDELLAGASTEEEIAGPGGPVSYTHLRAHETVLDLVCRL